MKHALKTWPEYFQLVKNGKKPFEVRRNDRNYQEGDTLLLREWHRGMQAYTGEELTIKVTYILRDPEFVKEGYVILGLGGKP